MIHLVRNTFHIKENIIYFTQDDSHYLLRVRRVRQGDSISLFADSRLYSATISDVSKRNVTAQIDDSRSIPEPQQPVTLVLSVGDRKAIEQAIKNGVEAGVHHIIVIASERSNGDIAGLKEKVERLHLLVLSAASQSHRLFCPTLAFSDWNTMVEYPGVHYLFHPKRSSTLAHSIGGDPIVWIGPEGGFTDGEIARLRQRDATVISLPMPVLRMENGVTAALTFVAINRK